MDSLYKSCVWLATQARRDDLKWQNIALIIFSHTTAVWGLFKYGGQVKLATVLFAYVIGGIGGFGVTAGAHRLWTHRTYKAKWPLRVILLFCYSVAGQNSLYDWVRDHRVHHKFSDTDADPHNANKGFFFSHIGWLMCKKHPEVIAKGNQLDLSDLYADPLVRYYQKVFIYFRAFLCFIIPPCMATYLWGEDIIISFITLSFIRYVLSLNFTFLVNSAAHLYGYKPYDARIFPSQNKWVSMVAMGEGWHNYHHVFPWDYRAAEFGTYSLNITTLWLDLFAKIGWAYDMKKPSEKMIRAHAMKYAGAEHPHEVNEEEAMELENEDDKMTAFDYIKNKPTVEDANGNVEDKTVEQISNVETVVKSKSVEEDIQPTVQKRHIKHINEIASDNNNYIEPINDKDMTNKNKPVEQMNGFESIINNKTDDFINSLHTMMKKNPAEEPMSGFDSLIMNGGILIKDKAA